MPRLSNELYSDQHSFLRTAWLDFQDLYTVLSVSHQWEIHAYYQPAKELTQAELVHHRKTIGRDQPTLPARAGKHFDRLYRTFRVAYAYSAGNDQRFRQAISQMSKQAPSGNGRVRVRAVARPEPNLELLARALIASAEEQLSQELP